MATKPLPSQDVLRQLFRYEPDTGRLVWLVRDESTIPDDRARLTWNKRFAGKEAFSINPHTGYRVGGIFSSIYPAHRVIWKWMTGDLPTEVDHIDGNGSNNMWSNLRSVSHSQNARNQKLHKNSTTRSCGVHKLPSGNFHLRASENGKRRSIGTFDSIEAAERARAQIYVDWGYHPNHGRSAS